MASAEAGRSVRFFGQGVRDLSGDELWHYIATSDHAWQTWLDGYGAGFAAAQGELIDKVLRAEADADRYYVLTFNPRETIRICESYAEVSRRRGEFDRARRAEERINRLFSQARFPKASAH